MHFAGGVLCAGRLNLIAYEGVAKARRARKSIGSTLGEGSKRRIRCCVREGRVSVVDEPMSARRGGLRRVQRVQRWHRRARPFPERSTRVGATSHSPTLKSALILLNTIRYIHVHFSTSLMHLLPLLHCTILSSGLSLPPRTLIRL